MAKKKKASLIGLVLLAVAALGAVLAVVGIFVDWVKYTTETVIGNGEAAYTLKELAESNADLKKIGDGMEMFDLMNAFAYITMILSVVSAASVLLVKFLKIKLLKPIAGLAGVLTIVSTILMIVFVCMFCSKNAGFSIGGLAKGSFGWAAGAVFAVIGGFFAGLGAMVSYKK